jgi:predicted PurR-regulated permease PerM
LIVVQEVRKKTSAVDRRPSATTLGVVGIGCLLAALLFIIAADIISIIRQIKNIVDHMRAESAERKKRSTED